MATETVRVIVRLVALPDKVEELSSILSEVVDVARQDAGCISYDLQQNIGDPAEFVFVGEWRDDGSFDRHIGSAPLQRAMAALEGVLAAPPELRRYQPLSADRTADEAQEQQRQQAALLAQIERLEVPSGQLALWSLGQAGFVIKGGSTIAYIDPYLSNSVAKAGGEGRRFPNPLDPAAVTHAQIVFATHEHLDHTDGDTLRLLMAASPQAHLIASPQGRAIALDVGVAPERISTPRLGERVELGGLSYTATPAAHYSYEVDDEGRSRWMGFLIDFNGVTLYHAGDTILFPELMAALDGVAIDVALLPFNGRDYFRDQHQTIGNLWPREIADLSAVIKPRVVIGIHNDMFSTNRINPGMLFDEIDRRAPSQRCHILQPGELYIYAK